MNYVIDEKIIYRSIDGTIKLINGSEHDTVILTALANKVFQLLVSHHGELVTREKFFAEVWDKQGLLPSAHTLNQYISTLRKILSPYFEDKEIIITVPKSGYMLNSDIKISSQPFNNKAVIKKKNWLPIYLSGLLAIIAAYFYTNGITAQPLKQMGRIGTCPVYDMSAANNHGEREFEMEVASNIAKTTNTPCSPNSSFYFYAQGSLLINQRAGVLFAKCKEWKNTQDNCQTIYINNWIR